MVCMMGREEPVPAVSRTELALRLNTLLQKRI